jgi:hypothetical protein
MENNFHWTGNLSYISLLRKGKGNQEKPGNYRGISLLSIFGKVFSGILAGRLRDWLIYHKALSVFQAGFNEVKRTTELKINI